MKGSNIQKSFEVATWLYWQKQYIFRLSYCPVHLSIQMTWLDVGGQRSRFKVTIRPWFSGAVLIFNEVSRKSRSSPRMPVCLFLGLVSQICPGMPISAAIWLRIGGQKLALIVYVYATKLLVAGALPWTPLGELTTLPQIPKSDPWRLTPVALAHYNSRLQRSPRLQCPNYGHLINITPWFKYVVEKASSSKSRLLVTMISREWLE